MRRFLERLLDRLSNKDKAKSTLWMVSAAIFLAISGTIGIILLLCVPSSVGTETPGFSQFSTPTSTSPLIDINPVEHASTFRLTAYIALGLVVFASVAYCGTQFGFLLARRRTVRRLHQAIKSTDLEAALAKLAHAPQFKPAGSLSAGLPPSDLDSDRDGVSPSLRRAQNDMAAQSNVRNDRIGGNKIASSPPEATPKIVGSEDVDAAVANWMKQRASRSNPSA